MKPITIEFHLPENLVAIVRGNHWHVPGNLDMEAKLNANYPLEAVDDDKLLEEVELVALEEGGRVHRVDYQVETNGSDVPLEAPQVDDDQDEDDDEGGFIAVLGADGVLRTAEEHLERQNSSEPLFTGEEE